MFKLTRINRLKHFLDQGILVYLKHAFVFANYFTVEQFGTTTAKRILENSNKPRTICRIVTRFKKDDHISGTLKSLKWLKVKEKLLCNDVMVYKCISNLTPE